MAKTVIDSLIVTLGLDPKDFKKGEKEAAAALLDLKKTAKETGEQVSKSSESGGSAIAQLGKRVAVVALIFKGLSFATKNVLEASRATYDLANAAQRLGESSRMLRNFENVAEIMGGSADGARKSIQGLKQSLFDLSFNGQVSQNLVQLGRLGVSVTGKGGRPREFRDVYMDTADALQRNIANGSMTESEALMFAESAGFDPGLARSMIGGRDAASVALARQEARRQVSDSDVAGATATEQAITSAGQAKDTAFLAAGSAAGFGVAQHIATGVEGAFTGGATGDASVVWESWKSFVEPLTKGLGDAADATANFAETMWGAARAAALGKGPAGYRGAVMNSARKHGVPADILAGVIGAESNWDPSAVSSAGATGIAQLMPQYFPNAGVNPVDDIDTAAMHLANLNRSFGGDWDKTLMAYNAGETRLRNSSWMKEGGAELMGETTSYPGRVYDAAERWGKGGTGGGTTTVDIGEVNVITSATDASGIAGGIDSALKRKLTAAQAPSQGPQ